MVSAESVNNMLRDSGFFFPSRRQHTRCLSDWSSDVCSSDLFYRNYQSSRFVKDLFVLRLKNAPSESALTAMNGNFADIIADEPIKSIEPTPEEIEDNDNLGLARIAFGFNRRD